MTSATAPSNAPGPPRASATLVLLRDSPAGPEVLMVRRADRGDQNSNAWVFPGGLLDPGDSAARTVCAALDEVALHRQLNLASNGLSYLVAALRETFEEAGLLLARGADGRLLNRHDVQPFAAFRGQWRELAPEDGRGALAALCEQQGWTLAVDLLVPLAHWITPLGMPKRFDTRFLLARAPEDQQVEVDGEEIVEHRWARPADVLAAANAHRLGGPARATLKALSVHADVDAALAHARAQGPLRAIEPRFSLDATGVRVPVLPQHPAWAEIGLLDPAGQGTVHHVLRPGTGVPLGEGIVRVTAPNDRLMTGSGPNTYLLRCGDDDAGDWVLIDPGPDDEAHVQAVLAALPGRLRGLLITQAHPDYSTAAMRLRSLTDTPLYGPPPDPAQHHDTALVPDKVLRGGEALALGPRLTLQVLHTSGDASNSLCYLNTQARLLFTGDRVMQGSTAQADSVIADGLDSLCGLHRIQLFDWIAPGRGFLSPAPRHEHDELPTPSQPTSLT